MNYLCLSRAISCIPLEEPQKIWSQGRLGSIRESRVRKLLGGHLVKRHCVIDGESEVSEAKQILSHASALSG